MRRASGRIERRPEVTFEFDGAPFSAPEGETLTAALSGSGVRRLRRNAVDRAWRGAFCQMGLCQECIVEIDGVHVEACRTVVTPGLRARSVETDGDDGP